MPAGNREADDSITLVSSIDKAAVHKVEKIIVPARGFRSLMKTFLFEMDSWFWQIHRTVEVSGRI